ncbi:recombinase family protein [Yersinia enterocolitica]|nr:recombinase family protein [Yersinia enterocolitica]
MQQLRKGYLVIVWKLDRLSSSMKDLLLMWEKIQSTEADFYSITEYD